MQVYASGFPQSVRSRAHCRGAHVHDRQRPNAGGATSPSTKASPELHQRHQRARVSHARTVSTTSPAKDFIAGTPTRHAPTRRTRSMRPTRSRPCVIGNAVECDYRQSGNGDGALAIFNNSTNGITQYTTTNFGSQMRATFSLQASTTRSGASSSMRRHRHHQRDAACSLPSPRRQPNPSTSSHPDRLIRSPVPSGSPTTA